MLDADTLLSAFVATLKTMASPGLLVPPEKAAILGLPFMGAAFAVFHGGIRSGAQNRQVFAVVAGILAMALVVNEEAYLATLALCMTFGFCLEFVGGYLYGRYSAKNPEVGCSFAILLGVVAVFSVPATARLGSEALVPLQLAIVGLSAFATYRFLETNLEPNQRNPLFIWGMTAMVVLAQLLELPSPTGGSPLSQLAGHLLVRYAFGAGVLVGVIKGLRERSLRVVD